MRSASDITRLAAASIAVALLVTALKYLAYAKTGSVALYSDALESVVNVVTAIAALVAVRISQRPPDRTHPFGHHKAEYFAVALEGWLIVAAALMILHQAHAAWYAPRTMTLPTQGLIINTLATVLNGLWAWLLIGRGRRFKSPALVADGWHIATDVVTSVGVLFGLLLALATGWNFLDPLLAALVAVNILWAGWRLTTESVRGLMDESVTAEIMAQIRSAIAASAEGALQVHDLKTRIAGRATFIECHLVVPGAMTVARSHEICDRIEAAVKQSVEGAEVVIHVEPEDEAQAKGALVLKQLTPYDYRSEQCAPLRARSTHAADSFPQVLVPCRTGQPPKDKTMALASKWQNLTAPNLADFEAMAAAAWDRLPANFRKMCGDLVIRVEDFAEDDVLDELSIDDPFDLMGLYQGVSLDKKSVGDVASEPDMVFLYRRAILDYWADGDEQLGHLVTHVLVHEIGHHFGFSDADMEDIEASVTG